MGEDGGESLEQLSTDSTGNGDFRVELRGALRRCSLRAASCSSEKFRFRIRAFTELELNPFDEKQIESRGGKEGSSGVQDFPEKETQSESQDFFPQNGNKG